jgi:hypothetical protein
VALVKAESWKIQPYSKQDASRKIYLQSGSHIKKIISAWTPWGTNELLDQRADFQVLMSDIQGLNDRVPYGIWSKDMLI